MHLVRSPGGFPFRRVAQGSVATVGAYDGIHLGHRKLLYALGELARDEELPSVVLSWEPALPAPAGVRPPRLMRFRDKAEALAAEGVDILFSPRLDEGSMAPATFIRQLLVHTLNVRHLVVGEDFRFAAGGAGTMETLLRAARALRFDVAPVGIVTLDGERVSGARVRAALREGDLARASRLLGRPYSMSGSVVRGEGAGRRAGFPTARVNLGRWQSPVAGLFAVRVRGVEPEPRAGIASLVARAGSKRGRSLDVHILDFDRDIYGDYIHVDFVARLASEREAAGGEALLERMQRETSRAREYSRSDTAHREA